MGLTVFRIGLARLQSQIGVAPFHTWNLPDGAPWTEFYRANGAYLLRFPDLADFHVAADGSDVICFPALKISESTSQHLYVNQVLPLVLSKLGQLVFHAGAVEVERSAIAFVAESGRGKSTLVASFATSGFRFITDDGLVVEERSHGFETLSSQPSIRLWDDSQDALIASGTPTAPALQYTSKSRFLAGDELRFCDAPRRLRRVYFLGNGTATDISIQPITAAEALMEWVKHSFLLDVEDKSRLASHFNQVAGLARQPIHYRLDYPRRYEDLPRVRQAIVAHAREADAPT